MRVRFNEDGEDLHVFETNDVAGVIAASKESTKIVFEDRFMKYESMLLNHYEEDGLVIQELVIYVEPY